MQFIKLPHNITHLLEKYQRDFLWGTTPQKKKLHLIKWKTVQLAKIDGGLGIQNLIHKHHALLGAQAWRLFKTPNAHWASILIAKYCNQRPTNTTTPTWKAIQKGWSYCQEGLTWNISNGAHIQFWTEPWLGPKIILRHLIEGPLPQHHQKSYNCILFDPQFHKSGAHSI